MKEIEEVKKKKTPKKKDKRKLRRESTNLTPSTLVENSPYSERPSGLRAANDGYQSSRGGRSRQLEPLHQPQPKQNENGVYVDTLFPSEHLVALSIAQSEMNETHQVEKDRMAAIDNDINMSPFPGGPTDFDLQAKNQIIVLDPEIRKAVATKCISSREDGVFVGPSGEDPKPSDPYVLSRSLIQKRFGSGVLLLRPMEMKPTQLVTRGDLIFQLWYGRVSLTIHETTTVIVSGDFFFVPRGNTYSVRNLRNEEAKFSYTVVKEIDAVKEAEEKAKLEVKDRESKLMSRQGTFVKTPQQSEHNDLAHTVGEGNDVTPRNQNSSIKESDVLSPRAGPSTEPDVQSKNNKTPALSRQLSMLSFQQSNNAKNSEIVRENKESVNNSSMHIQHTDLTPIQVE